MRSLMLCLLMAMLAFSSTARADDDDKTICQKAYRASDSGPDKLAACTRFITTNTGTPRERGMAHDVLAFAQFRQGQYAKALDEYTLETQVDPTTVFGYFMRARMLRLLSQNDKAIEAANQALKVTPGDWQSLVERGKAQAATGNLQAATADFDTATQSNPNLAKSADIQTALGLALNGKKDFAAAIGKFDAALAAEPNRKEAVIGRCDALKATNASKDVLDQCSAAISEIDAVTCQDYNNTTTDARAAACNRIFAATAPTGHALAIAHMWKGAEFRIKRQNDAALTEFNLAVQAAPDFWNAYAVRGNTKDAKGDLDGALADFDGAIKLNPPNYNVYKDRGNARILKGDYDGAIADFNIAMPHFANPLYTMIERGRAKLNKKDFDGAIADLSQPIDKPITSQSDLYRAYLVRCMAYIGKGDSNAAISDCNAAIRINPNTGGAYGERGIAYVAQGKLADALTDFDTAIKFNPNYIKYYAARGSLYERNKDFDNARADYQFVATKSTAFDTPVTAEQRQFARQRLAALPQSAPPPPQKDGALPTSTRVALVIGNGAYKNVPALPNPPKDANAVAKALQGVGFSVVKLSDDMPLDGFLQALRAFSRDAAKADWAVVYYAGHGMEIGGVNYLIPVDAKLSEDTDAAREAVSLELVIAAVSGAKKLRLVMLDACRDNPFAAKMQRSIGVQLVNKGLSNIEPDAGIMIVYATKHGETALDGNGAHSPFATAVMSDIPKPGIEVRRLFDVVRDDVMKATNREQQPFSYGSLPGSQEFYFVAAK